MLNISQIRIIVGSHFKDCAVPTLSSAANYHEGLVPAVAWGMNRGAFSNYLSCVVAGMRSEPQFSHIQGAQSFKKGTRDTRDFLTRPISRLADRYAIRLYGMQS